MESFTESFLLIFVLLNPFIMSIYLIEPVRGMSFNIFSAQLAIAGVISFIVLAIFAWAGVRLFEDVLRIGFHSFMIFGGIVFLIIGIRLILGVGPPTECLRADSRDISGAIAMPFIIGPGTISASVLASSNMGAVQATLAIALALVASTGAMIALKALHDYVSTRKERYVEKYVEVAGRVTALFTGSFAIEMILQGMQRWLELPASVDALLVFQ